MFFIVDLDFYINKLSDEFGVKRQYGGICYVNVFVVVLYFVMKRIIGRDGGYLDFFELRRELIIKYGEDGVFIMKVFKEVCLKYRL